MSEAFDALVAALRATDWVGDPDERWQRRIACVHGSEGDAAWRRFLTAERHLVARGGALALIARAEAQPEGSVIRAAARDWLARHDALRLAWVAGAEPPGRERQVARSEPAWGARFEALALDLARRRAVGIDGTSAYRFDLETGGYTRREVKELPPAVRFALLPDGRAVACHQQDEDSGGAIYLWDLDALGAKRLWKVGSPVTGLAVTPDGTEVVIATGRQLRTAALDAAKPARTKLGGALDVTDLAFTPDGTHLVMAGYVDDFEPVLEVWDWKGARRIARIDSGELPGPTSVTGAHRVALAGRRAYAVGRTDYLQIWDLASGAALGTVRIAALDVTGIAALGDDRVAIGDESGVTLWDCAAPDASPSLPPEPGDGLVLAAGGTRVLSSRFGGIAVRDAANAAWLAPLEVPIGQADWSPRPKIAARAESERIVAWYEAADPDDEAEYGPDHVDRRVRVFDLTTGAAHLVPGVGPLREVALSPDGALAAAVDRQGVRVWPLARPSEVRTLADLGRVSPFGCELAFAGASTLLVGADRSTHVVDLASDRRVRKLPGAYELVVSPDGAWVATRSGSHVTVRSVANGEVAGKARIPRDEVLGLEREVDWLAFAGSSRLLVRDGFGALHAFEVPSCARVFTRDDARGTSGLAVAPDGSWAIGAEGGELFLWDLATGETQRVGIVDGRIDDIAIAPDGRVVTSAGGALAIWELRRGTPLDRIALATATPASGPIGAATPVVTPGGMSDLLEHLRAGTAVIIPDPPAPEDVPPPPGTDPRIADALGRIAKVYDEDYILEEDALLKGAEKLLAEARAEPPDPFWLDAVWSLADAQLHTLETRWQRRARHWLELAAELGHGRSQARLGVELVEGDSFKGNEKLGRQWLRKAADAGVREALRDLGALLGEDGDSAGHDMVARAALAGESEAFFLIAGWLAGGSFSAPDLALARKAYELAAEEVPRAAAELALMWRDGRGGPADEERARHWHDAASDEGYDWSLDGRWRRRSRARG